MSDSVTETTEIPLYSSAEAAAVPRQPLDDDPPEAPSATAPAYTMSLKEAVRNCRKAYNQALAAAKARGRTDCAASMEGDQAYLLNLPILTSEGNIRGFIACITYGMANSIIRKSDGLSLLTAARIALAALPRQPRPVGRPSMNPHP